MKLSSKILSFLLITLFFQSFAAQQTAASISTVPEAVVMLRKIIINIPAGGSITLQDYEKQHSGIMVKCAKILHDSAYAQILDTLQEIDNRIAYWRYQKNHPWGYFLAKNPMKWVMGASQDVE